MAEDWRAQLRSDDPKIRAQAVKNLALSGDQSNLKYLKEIVENDPNPQLREYAKKAARHLYTSAPSASTKRTQTPAQPQPTASSNKPAAPQPRPERKPAAEKTPGPPPKRLTDTERSVAESKIQRALAYHIKGQTQKGLKSFTKGLDLNPYLAEDTFTRSVASELTGLSPDEAIRVLKDPEERQELINPNKSKPRGPARAPEAVLSPPDPSQGAASLPDGEIPLIQIWLRFFRMTEEFFQRILVQANTEDTLISVLVYMIASMLTFLISSFGQLQQITAILGEQLGGQMPDLSPYLLGVLISMIFLTPLSFYLGAGAQFLGLRIFGGLGTFKQHSYILAMIMVPMTVLSFALSLPSLVPGLNCIAGLAGLGLSIFSIINMVRGMKAVHNLSTGQTIAGLIVPPLVLAVIGGCLMSLLGSALMNMLGNMITTQGGFPQ